LSALLQHGFVVRVPSWHRLENVIFDEYPGREVAFLAAGPRLRGGRDPAGRATRAASSIPRRSPARWFASCNEDGDIEWRSYRRSAKEKGLRISQLRDGAPGPLHGKNIKHVNKTYEPIQNTVPWDILDTILSDERSTRGSR
jgi:hypothetical protein